MRKILFVLFATAALAACQKENYIGSSEPQAPTTATRAYFHYFAMDNTLSYYADVNINAMLRGATKESLGDGTIIVLRDVAPKTENGQRVVQNTQLIQIFWDDRTKKAYKTVLKTYEANLDTSDPATFERAFADAQNAVDSDEWAVGFGSHGLGWIPYSIFGAYGTASSRRSMSAPEASEVNAAGLPLTRFLIEDDGGDSEQKVMEIGEFADMLPSGLKFVLMDFCFMGGVEFSYLLKDKADYIIVSPAEVVAQGFPYDLIVDGLFAADVEAGLKTVCDDFNDFYYSYSDAAVQFGTVALVDCSKMDAFAAVMSDVVAGKESEMGRIDKTAMQKYDRFTRTITFDLRDFVGQLYPAGHPEFDAALAALVPYKKSTGKTLIPGNNSLTVDPEHFSGLSTYVMLNEYSDLNLKYEQTEWYKAVF